MEFIDLKKQYELMKAAVDSRIQSVLSHGQFIMGPEVKELEDKLAAYLVRNMLLLVPAAPMRC